MSLFVINRLVCFDNESFTLYATAAPEDVQRIGAIASRCLTHLLEANGQIVSKRDLMSGAWGAFGLEVSENSLAQVVRQVRVAMEALQPGQELILTVPRIGYKITQPVERLEPTAAVDPGPNPTLPTPTPEPTAPLPVERPHRRLPLHLACGLGAIACWAALFFLPALLAPAGLPNRPFVQDNAVQLGGMTVHLEAMPASALQPDNPQLVDKARQLAQSLGMAADDLHLYRMADRYRSLSLLCQGQLEHVDSQCVGMQLNE